MSKKFAIAFVGILIAVAAGFALWSLRTPPVATGPALPAFDYAAAGDWAVRPQRPTPAVWEAGWETDVVLLVTDAALDVSTTQSIQTRREAAAEEISEMAKAFEPVGTVYAPYLRAGSLDRDVAAAFNRYLSTDNRGRAFVIATDAALPPDLMSALSADALLLDRFGGVLAIADDPADGALNIECTRRFKPETPCAVPVELRRSSGRYQLSGHEVLIDGFEEWLNRSAAKLAEPLGDLEEIEIVEIQKAPEGE